MNRLAPFVVSALLSIAVYGLPVEQEWTELASIAGSRDQPKFPGMAKESEAQSLAIEIEPEHLERDISDDSNDNATEVQTRFGYFNKPYPPFYAGFVPSPFDYKPFAPPSIPFAPYGSPFGSNFASGLNSTGFFWNGAFYPFETTTTTTSAPSSGGGNYYAFFFREGDEAPSTESSSYHPYGTDLQSVQGAIANAQSIASEHGFPFAV